MFINFLTIYTKKAKYEYIRIKKMTDFRQK